MDGPDDDVCPRRRNGGVACWGRRAAGWCGCWGGCWPAGSGRAWRVTRLQYGLVERAVALGWARSRVLVIDEDLGRSGASAVDWPGFERLVTEVTMDHVGVVLGMEMSRLARAGKDWHQLLELCSLARTLLADADGVYDPNEYNDRLLLGLKGTMSEVELHLIKQRMQAGRLAKAGRGELALPLPIGYARRPNGEVVFDPDEQVQSLVRLVFRLFSEWERSTRCCAIWSIIRCRWGCGCAPVRTRANWCGGHPTG